MGARGDTSMRFSVRKEDAKAAYAFVESLLQNSGINDKVLSESLLIFEALFQAIVDSDLDESTTVEIFRSKTLDRTSIKIGFEGKPFSPYANNADSIEGKILKAHDDKLDFSYRTGYNLIRISVVRNYHKSLIACLIAILCAIVAYIPLSFLIDEESSHLLCNGYIFPIEGMYANAVLMIGAPMTFFSLLKNLTDTYVVAQRDSSIRRLQGKMLATSVLATALAFAVGLFLRVPLLGLEGVDAAYGGSGLDRSFADVVSSIIPSSIFEPFESISPLPLIMVALLVTYALCSAGKHFDLLRQSMEACYALFSRMLHVVIAILPIFCFFAFMDVLLSSGLRTIGEIVVYLLGIFIGLCCLFASYAIRLRTRGIRVIPFARKLAPLLRENFAIGSAIEATPFNIRYCVRAFGMRRSELESDMPVLAQINLDGNCFIITMVTLLFMFVSSTEASWLNLAGLAMLVLFLSFGAPNQPGSILIALLIVITYLHSPGMICMAIYSEALLADALNIVNVIGDIVTMAIEERDVLEVA